jgi:hypothetical protein
MSTIGKYVFWGISTLLAAAGVELTKKAFEMVFKKIKGAKEAGMVTEGGTSEA